MSQFLKKAMGNHPSSQTILSTVSFDMKMLVEPESVHGMRPSTLAENGTEVLIHWKDLPSFEDS